MKYEVLQTIKIAATGNHYLAVRFNPILETGAIREAWNLEMDQQSIALVSNKRGLKS